MLESKVEIEISKASRRAIKAIEKRGGKITCRYYTKLGLRVLLHPERFDSRKIPRFANPTLAKDVAYYTSWERRGYLASKPEEKVLSNASS